MRKKRFFKRIIAVVALVSFSVMPVKAAAASPLDMESGAEESAPELPAAESQMPEAESQIPETETTEPQAPEAETVESVSLYQFGEFPAEEELTLYASDRNRQEAERAIYGSLERVEETLELSQFALTPSEVRAAVVNVVNHSPELFYVGNKYSVQYDSDGIVHSVQWRYTETDKAVIRQKKGEMESRCAEILGRIREDMSDVEKLMILHDSLIMNTTYTKDTAWNPGQGCYTAYCVLVEGKGVCHGYALAFSYLASRVGIDTRFVASDSLDHAWNLVQAEEAWYHLDCTWDDLTGGYGQREIVRHKNFLLSDAGIRKTGHRVWNDPSLSSTSDRFDEYYWRDIEGPILQGSVGWLNLSSALAGNCTVKDAYVENGLLHYRCLSASGAEEWKNIPESSVPILQKRLVLPEPGVQYQVHVQTYGWQERKEDGATSGTESQSKRLEAIRIELVGQPYSGGIQYRTHVQSYGWQDWKENGSISGTENQSKRLEAIQIRLTGAMAEHYDIYYRVHAQSYGWLDWAGNGESAGTEGLSKRLEAIQICLVKKNGSVPGTTELPYVKKNGISYQTHVQTYGWQDFVKNSAVSGTVGRSKRLEGISMYLTHHDTGGGLEYRTHVQTYGWQDYVAEDNISGTTGESKRLEAIQIRLTGTMDRQYDIYYRVHVQTYGWLGWAKNGEEAGTEGMSRRLEGIQIVLVPKGGEAPGSSASRYLKR